MIHELAHKLFCDWTGTRVLKISYFRLGNPAGYVVHERPSNVWKTMLIGVGPFLVNTVAGFLTAMSGSLVGDRAGRWELLAHAVILWLAVSIVMHSFPSTGDARGIWKAVSERGCPVIARIAAIPVVGFIYLGALGSMFWLNLAYALLIALAVPAMLGVRPW